MTSRGFRLKLWTALAVVVACAALQSAAAEKVSVKLGTGQPQMYDVVKITKAMVTLKGSDGKEQSVPLAILDPKEVLNCYKQVRDVKNAALRFDMGAFFAKKKLVAEAEEELKAAVDLDPKLAQQADAILKGLAPKEEVKVPAIKDPPKEGPKEDKPDTKKPDIDSANEDENVVRPGETVEQAIARIQKNRKFEVPAKGPDEVKKFNEERLKDLKDKIGGNWNLIETEHYYCFANVAPAKHQMIAHQWNEALYKRLADILQHKEGDKLWNNKCPIYYFEKYSQFQQFAAEIDGAPGAGNSGGYFMHLGREVHICIPFMTERKGEKAADRMARSTLYHEGTHAFLQLVGEDVPLARWLHEGMAQFMEFWVDDEMLASGQYTSQNPERSDRAQYLLRKVNASDVPSWSQMRMRPAGGTDLEGYAWAWARFEYFFRTFRKQDPTSVPRMVRAIKAGKTEEEAILDVFKQPLDKLEADYRNRFLKVAKDMGFKFQNM